MKIEWVEGMEIGALKIVIEKQESKTRKNERCDVERNGVW